MKVKLFTGEELEYEENAAGFGWTTGTIGDREITLYIREAEHGGGVFVKIDGELMRAETGEPTVQFNNRIWTQNEEAEEIERIKLDAQD